MRWPLALFVAASCRSGADLEVRSAEEIGILGRDPAIQGRDGGPSAALWGETVWTYGDTVLYEPDVDGTNWHTNSWDHAPPDDWATGLQGPHDAVGAPAYLIPLTAAEVAFNEAHAPEDCPEAPCGTRWALWPSQPLVDATADRAWFLYGLYADDRPSGIGVATWGGLDQPVQRVDFDGSWLLFPQPEVEWANAPVVHDGFLWTFGCPIDFVARPCSLARVPIGEVDRRGSWRFWDGRDFVRDANDAATLFDGAPIMAVSWNAALDRWLLVYSDAFGPHVFARTAPELTGPWSKAVTLYDTGEDVVYDAQHHAEVEEDGGAVQYVTWSRSTGEGWFGSEHAIARIELAR